MSSSLAHVVQALPRPAGATSTRGYTSAPFPFGDLGDARIAARDRARSARRWMGEEIAPGVLRCPVAAGAWTQEGVR